MSLYNNDRAYSNSWIVYINGLQVPVAGVSVAHGVWQIPQASIQMVPEPVLQRLGAEDRVMVQVFYCDQWYRTTPEFCLFFDGEIVAWSYTQAGNSRAISFACIDYMQILTQIFFFFMGSIDDIGVGVTGENLGVGINAVNTPGYAALYPYALFSQGLADPGDSSANTAPISRPIDFAYNIVRSLIKAQHPNRTIPAANFFAPWCKRTNFHKRWIALPYIDADPGGNPNVGVFPILRAQQAGQALAAVARMASTTGAAGSMWDMLRDILMTMMMEVSMNPAPAAVHSDFATLLPKGPPTEGITFLANYCVKPQFFFGLPPTCNVFFPPQIESYNYGENYITQPTRMYFNEEAILSALSANGSTPTAALGALLQDAMTTGYPEEVDTAARAAVNARGLNGKNILVFPEEFFKGPVVDRRAMPRWFAYMLAATQPTGAGAPTPTTTPADDDAADGETAPHYQIRAVVASDVLSGAQGEFYGGTPGPNANRVGVAAPPEIWPLANGAGSGYNHQSKRSYIEGQPPGPLLFGEVRGGGRLHKGHDISAPAGTAILATCGGRVAKVYTEAVWNTADIGESAGSAAVGNGVLVRDIRGGLHYYMHMRDAPMVVQGQPIHTGDQLGVVGNSGNSLGNHLHYQVETATGHFLDYTDLLLQLKTGHRTPQATTQQQPVAAPPAPTASNIPQGQIQDPRATTVSAGDTSRNLFKLYAAYEYYKERYSRRQGSVSMAFNPYPVAGFPCMTFDRRSSAVDTVGYVMSVRHTLNTQQISSEVAFSHGRTLQEAFALMQRTYALDAARLGFEQARISQAIQSGVDRGNVLAAIPLPTGALAMAPAEPIPEIQAVIQNFERADEFYKALFQHGRAPGADVLGAEQQAALNRGTDDVYITAVAAQDIADALARGETPEQVMTIATSAVAATPPSAPVQRTTPAEQPSRRGVFFYPEVIDMVDDDGVRTEITIEGADVLSRTRLLEIIAKIRLGIATGEEIQIFYTNTGQNVTQPAAGQPPSADLTTFLNAQEYTHRSSTARTNVRGDVTLVPRLTAEPLFQSYTAAMAYVGRPICTLEEYIRFLGEDGLREGRVTPSVTSANRDPQIHPAPFYTRIRRLRTGPPTVRPVNNTTGTETVSDGPAGGSAPAPDAAAREALTSSAADFMTRMAEAFESTSGGLPVSATLFAERMAAAMNGGHTVQVASEFTASMRDIGTIAGAQAAAEALATQMRASLTGAQTTAFIEQMTRALTTSTTGQPPTTEEFIANMRAAAATGLQQTVTAGIAGTVAGPATQTAPVNTPTIAANTPEAQPGTYMVEGIPTSFPETRANWDAILEKYRANVLTKKSPNT